MVFSNRFEFDSTATTTIPCSQKFKVKEKLGPNDSQQRLLFIVLFQSLILITCTALQLHLILMLNILAQHQALKQEGTQAIQCRDRALQRYRQLRNRFMRKKKQHWKNPGCTEKWWSNMWDGLMLPEEWLVNFRRSKEDFINLQQI